MDRRKVVIRMTVDYIAEFPADWDKDLIEFQRNEGSWCSDNDIRDLAELLQNDTCTFCPATSFEYLREATQEDYDTLPDIG